MAVWKPSSLLVLPLVATAVAAASSWIEDAELQRAALARHAVTPPRFTVDLDLPPKQRWAHVFADPRFRNASKDIAGYFRAMVPAWIVKLAEGVAYDLRKHFEAYAEEIEGIEELLGSKGDVALVNLASMLEEIGNNKCTMANTTGPCEGRKGPGLCTSFVAETPGGTIWHGRNMDWNLPDFFRKYVIDVEFTRSNRTLFKMTTVASHVGAFHGLRPGQFSVSINARDKGGEPIANLWEFITHKKGWVSPHLLRQALETTSDYGSAVKTLSSEIIDEHVYFIVGGTRHGEGVVLARDRFKTVDAWHLGNATATHQGANNTQSPWFRLQTNYDHWLEVPKWDDRRTPGVAHLQAVGQAQLGVDTIFDSVLKAWPTLNDHTDITAVLSAATGEYKSVVWRAASQSQKASSRSAIFV
jgi:hypothetical protein